MKRECVPSPMMLTWSRAAILNFNSRPLISVSTAVAVITSPTFVAFECSIFRAVPTVVWPSYKWVATAIIAAFSIRAHIAGVASTAKSPEPIYSAVTSGVTRIVAVNDNPSFIFILFWCAKVVKFSAKSLYLQKNYEKRACYIAAAYRFCCAECVGAKA